MDEALESNELSMRSTNNKDQENMINDHRLILLLVQCACEERVGQCDSDKLRKLQKWLEFLYASDDPSDDHHDPPGVYVSAGEVCYIDWPDSTNSNVNIPREIPNADDKIILGHIVYYFGDIMNLFVQGKWDLNYRDCRGNTILHRFFHNRICVPTNACKPENGNPRYRQFIKGLIELNIPLFAMNKNGFTLFETAACRGHIWAVQMMADNLANVEECDGKGQTALHIVVNRSVDFNNNHKDGYVDIVRTLVAKGADVNARNSSGLTPVHHAAENFQTEMLKLFADKGANFDERTNDGENPLRFVCKSKVIRRNSPDHTSKSIGTFEYLVSKGCAVEVVDKEGYMPLHFAAELRCVEIVEGLIALGVNVNCRTKETLLTPLYLAAKSDKLDDMKALVRAGANVNAEAADGSTPIFMSALAGSYESMQFLIDNGADLHRRDSLMGFTLLHMAASSADLEPEFRMPANAQTKDRLMKLKVLIDRGLNVNDVGICGVNPLQLAALAPNFDAVKLLLDSGAKVDLPSSQWTALHSVSLMKALDIVEILVARGADVTQPAGAGKWTPLHLVLRPRLHFVLGHYPDCVEENDARLSCPIKGIWKKRSFNPPLNTRALSRRCVDLMAVLIDNGAEVDAENAFGQTPLLVAADRPFEESETKKLLDSGARVYVQDKEGKLPLYYACKRGHEVGVMKMLLDFGADINDDDSSELIVNSKCEWRNLMIEHAIKLKLVGFHVAKVYEPFISAPEFADFYERCSKEATNLKNHRDANGFSLYKFLRMNAKLQYLWIERISDSYENVEKIFPIYGDLIRSVCREAVHRKPLLESARIAWSEVTNIYLPDVCVERILSFLSNTYLKVFTTAIEKTANVENKGIVFAYDFR